MNSDTPRTGRDLLGRLLAMGPSMDRIPRLDPRRHGLPDVIALAGWRSRADGELEATLARFDQRLLGGADGAAAAREAVAEFMAWTRSTIAAFVVAPALQTTSRSLREAEHHHWNALADSAAAAARLDPTGLERFMRVWLAAVHEAAATGYASLYVDLSG